MADITYTQKATERRASPGAIPGKGDANSLKVLCSSTIEVASVADGSTLFFGRIPSSARISGMSRVYWDDLTTTGAPTLDIGLASVDSNITSDPNGLSDAHDVTAADVLGEPLIDDIANFGKQAWEHVSGQTTDPGGSLDVYGSIVDAATVGTGTITVEVIGYLD